MEIDEAETEAETETKTGNQTGEKLITSQIFGVPCLCFQLWEFLFKIQKWQQVCQVKKKI